MRLCVAAKGIEPGARVARAARGLAARGHAVAVDGGLLGGGGFPELEHVLQDRGCDVLIGGRRPAWAVSTYALSRARAVVLALEPESPWGLRDRWAWGTMEAFGLIEEAAMDHFLASMPVEQRDRLALWPAEASAPDAPEASTLPETDVLERACERALARRAAGPGRAALFVDRDGTLVAEKHHLSDPDELELLPGVAAALREVRGLGHPVVVISNQAGVGRGLFPESRVHDVMARLRRMLRADGVELDAIRYCPHAPEEGCDCRKPRGRLLAEAADDLRLSLRDSVMVGDKWIDVDAGRAVGATGALVRTGYGAEEEKRAGERAQRDPVFDDLPAAARWFIDREA